ncbi:hypothetical protein [Arthrobacter polaris]|uniref:hypothetical protein n=1 Tax=Arthrobacter polaris TaxID=2813727 RepID=UPI001F47D1D0|nr:hypothetical protein [Arthrobacter polaris]UIK89412.1 hypothetical protein J0916_02845 [Arthrobacter polaris]
MFTVLVLTFAPIQGPDINTGIRALVVNITVVVLVQLFIRNSHNKQAQTDPNISSTDGTNDVPANA